MKNKISKSEIVGIMTMVLGIFVVVSSHHTNEWVGHLGLILFIAGVGAILERKLNELLEKIK